MAARYGARQANPLDVTMTDDFDESAARSELRSLGFRLDDVDSDDLRWLMAIAQAEAKLAVMLNA